MRVDVVQPIDNVAVAVDAPDSVIDLSATFDDPFTTGQVATFELNNPEEFGNNGQIQVLLFDQPGAGAPNATANFASFVNDGAFANLAINRGDLGGLPGVGTGFVVQAGQFTIDPETSQIQLVPVDPTVVVPGEPSPGRSNQPGTIAFALSGGDPDSANSQFFFNLNDNSFLDPMFTVFGEVLSAEDLVVVDTIVNDPIFAPFQGPIVGPAMGGGFLPIEGDPTAGEATFAVDDPNEVISFSNISIAEQEELTFAATSSNPELVIPNIDGGNLTLDFVDGQTGIAEVTVEATNLLGDSTTETFFVGVGDDVELPAEGPPNGVEIVQPIDDLIVGANAPGSVIDLFENFDDPFTTGQVATFELNNPEEFGNNGQIQILLFDQEEAGAPTAVANFVSFVNSGAFTNLAVNRGDLGPFEDGLGFIVQTGPISVDPETFEIFPVPIGPDVQFSGEPNPDLPNVAGTVAFALPVLPGTSTPNPDALTNVLSFNLADNSAQLDPAFAVFGEVLSTADFEVVDAIANDPVFAPFQGPVTGPFMGGGFLPIQIEDPVTGEDTPDMFVVDDPSEVLFFPSVSIAQQDELTFTATSSNPELVVPSVEGGNLTLDVADGQLGTAEVTVEATNLLGDTVTETFSVEVTDEVVDVEPDAPDVEPEPALDPGTIVVDTLLDEADGSVTDGDVSLRDALAAIEPGNTIVFAEELTGEIALNGTELVIDRAVTIDGGGDIIVNAGGQSRVFLIGDGDPDTQDLVTLSGLAITGGVADIGGGISSSDSDLTLIDSVVTGNLATTAIPGVLSGSGGGIAVGFGSLNLVDSIVSDNAADIFAGGVFGLAESPLNISNSIISGNSATDGGAIAGVDPITLTGSTISNNSAASTGGGILIPVGAPGVAAGPVTIANSTIADNSATFGGGIYNAGGQADITNSTITGNTASTGSGISSFGDAIAQTTVTSSIVSGNIGTDVDLATPPTVDVADAPNSFTSNGNNLIGDGNAIDAFSGPGDITGNTDPGLAALADNGGPTPTIALLPDSPAIDTGSNPNNLETDQRGTGFSRVAGAATDIGAFEVGGDTADDPTDIPDILTPGGPVDLNVDGSEGIEASVDILNIFRVLAGAPQAVVVPAGVSQQAVTDAVNAFPDLGLDVDDSGEVEASVDVLNIFRVLAGAPQAVVIPDGVGASQQSVADAVNALVG